MTRSLVTGTTSGIGRAIAEAITANKTISDNHLIMAVRDIKRGHELRHTLSLEHPGTQIDVIECNLASRGSVDKCAELVLKRYGELDVLINNAGAMFARPRLAESGFELTFATNHLGPFQLTNLLLPALTHSRIARVVNVASKMHLRADMDFDHLDDLRNYSMWSAYSRSKLANVMFSNTLAKRLDGTNIRVNALHPGTISSQILPGTGRVWPLLARLGKTLGILKPAADGAATPMYLAFDPGSESMQGLYLDEHQIPQNCAPQALQVNLQERLWALSATAVGLD